MNAELNHHLGYEKHAPEGRGSGNNRNGRSRKKVQGDFGAVEIEVPRDRNGTFEPKILPSTNDGSLVSTRRFCRCTRAA
jgi:putative transposase